MRKAVWLIAAAIAGVITIACLNVAHLLMVRLRERRHELAVRAALGAGRIAALRHAVFESVLLAAAGLVVALPLVTLMVRALHRFAPPDIPRLDAVMLGGELVPIVALATLGIGLCVGAASTLDLRAGALHDVLRSQARGYSGSATWGRIVVAMEVAVSITVAVPAVLLLRSFLNVATTAPGFEIQRALTFQVRMPARYREYPEVVDVYDRVIRELQAVNGVTSAAYTWQLPMGQTLGATSFSSETGKWGMALIHRVSPGFFQAMGMRVTRGAGLASQSDLPAVVVNETFAGVHWGDVDPIGAVMTVDGIRSRITGIVNDIRQTSLEQPPAPEMYRAAVLRSMYVVVRTEGAAGTFRSVIRDAIARVDPSIPVSDIRTLEERLARTMARRRSIATGVVVFGITAALLALIGLYGVTAVVVAGRRREIAIRMALGSTAGAVITMFIRWMLPAIAAGLMIGGMAAWILGRQMQSMLFGIQSGDPWTYAVTAVVLAAATLIATYVPARRAGRTSPAEVFGS